MAKNAGITGAATKRRKKEEQETTTATTTKSSAPKDKKTTKRKPKVQASTREGTKVISGHYPESAYKQFKVAATMDGRSLQDALATALNLYLEDQNMAPVFPINKPKD